MKPILFAVAVAICAALPAANAQESFLEKAARERPMDSRLTLTALYARPVCHDDGRDLPRGSQTCRNGRLMICSPRGTWQDSGRPC